MLDAIERRHLSGRSVANYFDLIVGTSTGGILALGLAAGLTAGEVLQLYVERGAEVFPRSTMRIVGPLINWLTDKSQVVAYRYNSKALAKLLTETFQGRLFGDATVRLCIPAFDGRHSEVFVFKTPHHPDYQIDRFQLMSNIALATSAAPTYFRPLAHDNYILVDGGVWANNPVMLGLVEALSCFDVSRDQIRVMSIGCGDERYVVSRSQIWPGGIIFWRNIMFAAMRLQSIAATNQARLLLGPPSVVRIDPPESDVAVPMDDRDRAVRELRPIAEPQLASHERRIIELFLTDPVEPFVPCPVSTNG